MMLMKRGLMIFAAWTAVALFAAKAGHRGDAHLHRDAVTPMD